MRWRDLLAVGGAVSVWSAAAVAQQPEHMRRIGVLLPFPENDVPALASVKDFTQALRRLG
jgi:hypothetical protein